MGFLNTSKWLNKGMVLIALSTCWLTAYARGDNLKEDPLKFTNTVHNVGEIIEGQKAIVTFQCTNKSKYNVQVKKIKTDCSCTIVDVLQKNISPNESIPIKVAMKTNSLSGEVSRKIIVKYEANGHSYISTLELQANITQEGKLVSKPKSLVLKNISPGDLISNTLQITNAGLSVKADIVKLDAPQDRKSVV